MSPIITVAISLLLLLPFVSQSQDSPFSSEEEKREYLEKLFNGKWDAKNEGIVWNPNFEEYGKFIVNAGFNTLESDGTCYSMIENTLTYTSKKHKYVVILFNTYARDLKGNPIFEKGTYPSTGCAVFTTAPNPYLANTEKNKDDAMWKELVFRKCFTEGYNHGVYGGFSEFSLLKIGEYHFLEGDLETEPNGASSIMTNLFSLNPEKMLESCFIYNSSTAYYGPWKSETATTLNFNPKKKELTLEKKGTKFIEEKSPENANNLSKPNIKIVDVYLRVVYKITNDVDFEELSRITDPEH